MVAGVNFEWIRTTLPAGCDAGWYPACAPGSHEFVVVNSGTLRLRSVPRLSVQSPVVLGDVVGVEVRTVSYWVGHGGASRVDA